MLLDTKLEIGKLRPGSTASITIHLPAADPIYPNPSSPNYIKDVLPIFSSDRTKQIELPNKHLSKYMAAHSGFILQQCMLIHQYFVMLLPCRLPGIPPLPRHVWTCGIYRPAFFHIISIGIST